MNRLPSCSKSKQNDEFDEDEIFDDSILAHFEKSFKQTLDINDQSVSESNINSAFSKDDLNISALCCDEELSGYDKNTGKTWIYPTNYPVRDYQFNIIRTSLLKNTLVSLPTGLGKTFIAAVIMYNFYRWYPLGKIIFTAPTRPLVAQQIDACYKIIAIPLNDTIEMTGHMQVNTRKSHWQSKRVFFATPQVIYNDIKSGICPSEKIRCLVIDEAHRAKGNYAYCQIVSTLDDLGHKIYRLLALSATPGSKVEDVITVVKNLHIAHLELRTEDCIDVAPYSHARKINTVIIQLSKQLTTLRQQYVEILDGYARRLKQLNILPHNLGNLSKGRIVMLYKEFQNKERGARHPQHNFIMKDFTLLIALFHGLELLVQHGSRVFLNFFDEHPEKSWIQSDDKLTMLLERLRDDLGINPLSLDRSILPDGTVPEMPKNLCFGHPKFDKLKEIMISHFTKAEQNKQDTRAIVFCEYRESVNLVHCLLLQCRPLIKPQMFVGQGASGKDGKAVISQKQQARVMRSFREGTCNVLVATCVAEEGLDVGSVDLIICFDISTRSPRRLVQRCGRTGRERGGQVFILVTEGREHQTLLECMRQRDGLTKKILQSREVDQNLYKSNPRMLPHGHTPQCQKMFITVKKVQDCKEKLKDGVDKSKKGQKDLRNMLLRGLQSTNKGPDKSLTEKEFQHLLPDGYCDKNLLPKPVEYWAMNKESFKDNQIAEKNVVNLAKWLELQKTLQTPGTISHSENSKILTELLQFADVKRNEPASSTQYSIFASQESPRKVNSLNLLSPQKFISSPGKRKQVKKTKNMLDCKPTSRKDGDIRALFSKATKSTKSYTKLISDLGIQNDGSIPTKLVSLLVDLSLDSNMTKQCYFCQNICDCSIIQKSKIPKQSSIATSLQQLTLPDINLIDQFDADTILSCAKKPDEEISEKEIDALVGLSTKDNLSGKFDLELDFAESVFSQPVTENETIKQDVSTCLDNFDIGNIEDIFADSSPEEPMIKDIEVTENPKEAMVKDNEVIENREEVNEVLSFFGLDSIEDIFADDEIDNTPPETNKISSVIDGNSRTPNSPKTSIYECPVSPSILSGRTKPKDKQSSPILCSQGRKFQLSIKKDGSKGSTPVSNCRRQIIKESENNNLELTKDDKLASLTKNSLVDTSNKSMLTITQLVNMINESDRNESKQKSNVSLDVGFKKNYKSNISTSIPLSQSITNKRSFSPILSTGAGRSVSPILLTQSERNKSVVKLNNSKQLTPTTTLRTNETLIILDSDSDSDDTQSYDTFDILTKSNKIETASSPPLENFSKTGAYENTTNKTDFNTVNCKRKFEENDNDSITVSHYFNKKQKLDMRNINNEKTVTNEVNRYTKNDNFTFNCIVTPTKCSLKENMDPQFLKYDKEKQNNSINKNNLDTLQLFRRDSKVDKNELTNIFTTSQKKPISSTTRRLSFDDDSEDEFITAEKARSKSPHVNGDKYKSTVKYKIRKKIMENNSLLDMEAELSDDADQSGDELSDDSIGSIVDFICDDSEIPQEDMQAVYLKSIKSPIKSGAFKIPELPTKYNREEILSQQMVEDAYEMDSFCVDTHIGLTQVNEVSELELAEIILEGKRKSKKTSRRLCTQQDDSPDLKFKSRPKKRQILSDSEGDSDFED